LYPAPPHVTASAHPTLFRSPAREQCSHAGHVAVVIAGAVGVAEVDVVHGGGVQAGGAFGERAQHVRGQVVGADAGQGAAVAAEGGADRVEDVHVGHGGHS